MSAPRKGLEGSPRLEWLAAGLIFAALTVVVFWPQPVQWLTHAHGHHDTLFNMWRLSWITEALTTDPARLFDPPIFHPAQRVLAYSDAVLLQGLVALPALAAGAPILPVSNVVLLLGPWLSALGMYLLVRDLLAGRDASPFWPAVIAGAIFGLLPYRVEHVMHLELQWSQWMPLACWALHRTVEGGRVRDGVWLGVFVLAQFLSCIYYGVFLVVTLACVTPLLLLARGRAPLTRIAAALVVGMVVTAPVLGVYSAPYRANQATFGGRGADEIDTWSATAGSFISAPEGNRIYGGTAAFGGPEGRLWPGAIALLLGMVGVWSARRQVVLWMYAAMLVLSAVLAMGTHTPIYRVMLTLVPPLGGLRAPSRFGMVVALAIAVLAGLGAAHLLARLRAGWLRHVAGVLLVLGLGVEYASRIGPLHPWVQRAPMYARWLRDQPAGVVVDLPMARANALPHHEAEWSFYGRTHGHPMANGYSGYYPTPYLDLLGAMVAFPRGQSLTALRSRDVRYIVVHEDRYEPADYLELDARLRGTPGLRFLGRFPDPDYPVGIYLIEPR